MRPLQVCTAQYFVWYFGLLPLVLPRLPWPLPRPLLLALAAWLICQLHWLLWAYMLEFQVRRTPEGRRAVATTEAGMYTCIF